MQFETGSSDQVQPVDSPAGAGAKPFGDLVSRNNLALVIMFAAGIACVYLYSFRQGPAAATAQQMAVEQQVNTALAGLDAVKSDELKKGMGSDLVESFYCQANQRQIQLENLTRNPFVYVPSPAAPAAAAEKTGADSPEKEDEPEFAAVNQLRLQSVLSGAHGSTAMISNNVLAVGQKIGKWTVSKIEPRQVILTCENRQHVLRLDD